MIELSAEGRVDLELFEAFRREEDFGETTVDAEGNTVTVVTASAIDRSGRYPRILGTTPQDSFTLVDAFMTHRSGSMFGSLTRSASTRTEHSAGPT